MPELSHDTAEDGFHEIQLSGKQLVFLFIVTTSVVVGVFLFGVLVGRGARDLRASDAGPASTSEAPLPAAPAEVVPNAAADVPVPSDEEAKDLTYADRLREPGAPVEKLKPAGAERDRPTEAAKEPAPKPAVKAPPAAPVASKPAAAPSIPAGIPTSGRPGTWVVQVIATREPGIATSIVQKLTAKGYPAFLLSPAAGAPQPFYKVQVGRYNDRGEAEKVSTRIKKEEQFQSWILR